MRAPDLSREQPRPMDALADGYPWIPRMVDKARASRAGTLGDYFKYPCPIDREALGRLEVSAEDFAEVAVTSGSDGEVVARLAGLGANLEALADFDPVAFNEALHAEEGS